MVVTAVSPVQQPIQRAEAETQALLAWAEDIHQSDQPVFIKAQQLAQRLGAHYDPDTRLTTFGFWAPELGADMIQPKNIYLEIFTPKQTIAPEKLAQKVIFRHNHIQLEKQGEYFWGVFSGIQAGTTGQFGSFYWLRYLDMNTNQVRVIGDCLAYSLPYGVYAPAEVYDMVSVQRQRQDLDYLSSGDRVPDTEIIQVRAPTNILQLHVNTASPDGTIAGLTETYRRLGKKLVDQTPLTLAEQNFLGYDAVQLLPVEPTVEYRGKHDLGEGFFMVEEVDQTEMDPDTEGIEHEEGDLKVTLKKPDIQNWGYDIVIFGCSATNPAVLRTLRPAELVELIETLHNFPTGPIQVIYDIVYGHADNQAIDLLNGRFLKGPNMYGQDVNHQNPTVRAILLEMQRRKNDTGVDGIRVDGAQDFKFFNPISGRVEYDDRYLSDMAEVVQSIEGIQRQLFSIFEDGRPWPAEGWEDISTYRDIVEFKPDAFQWGPLIFAHNTPSLKKFWQKKWRRVTEQMQFGQCWITGCGNHDTLRRGTQVEPSLDINWNLGKILPEVLNSAYDNSAISLLTYGFSPGLPMDFINCTMRAPWGFLRNTDDRYGVKVVAEEAGGFLDWQIIPETYDWPELFPRVKAMGFTQLAELRQFVRGLYDAIEETGYDLDEVAQLCERHLGSQAETDSAKAEAAARKSASELQKLNVPGKSKVLTELDVATLKTFAKAFMEDAHEMCNVWLQATVLDSEQVAFNLALRQFRHQHPWLRQNLDFAGGDRFESINLPKQTVFYGLRTSLHTGPQAQTQLAIVAHMGGDSLTVDLADWLELDLSDWHLAIASPGLNLKPGQLKSFELQDSQAVLLRRDR